MSEVMRSPSTSLERCVERLSDAMFGRWLKLILGQVSKPAICIFEGRSEHRLWGVFEVNSSEVKQVGRECPPVSRSTGIHPSLQGAHRSPGVRLLRERSGDVSDAFADALKVHLELPFEARSSAKKEEGSHLVPPLLWITLRYPCHLCSKQGEWILPMQCSGGL